MPSPFRDFPLRKAGTGFAESRIVLCGKYLSTSRRVRWRTPHGIAARRARTLRRGVHAGREGEALSAGHGRWRGTSVTGRVRTVGKALTWAAFFASFFAGNVWKSGQETVFLQQELKT